MWNPVAKFLNRFNKNKKHRDRKKDKQRGKEKHRKEIFENE